MVIRYKEFYFDVDESALFCAGNRRADEQLIDRTGNGNAASSSAKKNRKKFQIFSRDRGGEVSKVEEIATGNEAALGFELPRTKDLNGDDISKSSAVVETVDKAKVEKGTQKKSMRSRIDYSSLAQPKSSNEKSAGVKALERDPVKLKEMFQEQQEHESEKCDQLASPAHRKSIHGKRDIYIDSIPRKSPVITGNKGNLKERNGEKKPNTYVVSSPQGGSNEILYAKERPYNQKKNGTERSSTLVLRTRLHCDDCIRKLQKCILKYKGVESVAIDASKDQVSVTGVVEMKELELYLKDKMKRNVEVVPTRKGGDEEIKDEVNTGGLGGPRDYGKKEEQTPLAKNGNQRDNHWLLLHPITHPNDGEIHNWNYSTETYQGYINQGASYQRFNQSYASDIFSDENPNACSIM